jgi:excisionase family DNA binding protein
MTERAAMASDDHLNSRQINGRTSRPDHYEKKCAHPEAEASRSAEGALTITQFCQAYAVGRTTAYEEIASGRLSIKKRGRKTLIARSAAQQWFNGLPEGRGGRDRVCECDAPSTTTESQSKKNAGAE